MYCIKSNLSRPNPGDLTWQSMDSDFVATSPRLAYLVDDSSGPVTSVQQISVGKCKQWSLGLIPDSPCFLFYNSSIVGVIIWNETSGLLAHIILYFSKLLLYKIISVHVRSHEHRLLSRIQLFLAYILAILTVLLRYILPRFVQDTISGQRRRLQ